MVEPILKKYMENVQADSNPTEPITTNKRRMDNSILSNKEWKESDYGNPINTTFDSSFKAHDERNIKKGNELRQMKHKGDNRNNEQPIKRVCKAEKFEAIKYSLRPNEEYIVVRRCEYNTWERNKESMSKTYQEIFSEKGPWMEGDTHRVKKAGRKKSNLKTS
ncbi:hypothetical protein Tco_1258851 [Tanacetum coccineum]